MQDQGIVINGINTQHKKGEISVKCKCSLRTKRNILKSLSSEDKSYEGIYKELRIKFCALLNYICC